MKKLLFISSTMLFTYSAFKAQNCAELFISKYASLGSNNKCVEIYNPTNAPIVLNGKYYIARYKTPTASGNTSGPVPNTYAPSTNGDTVWLKGTIASYSTWVVCNPEVTPNPGNFNSVCNPTLAAKANQKGNFYATYGANVGDPTYFKGCDAITLEKKVLNTYSIIDMIGRQGDFMASSTGKPSAWSTNSPYTGGTGMGKWITKGYLIIRKANIMAGVSVNPAAFNPMTQWDTVQKAVTIQDSINTYNKFGSHLCNCGATGIKESKQITKVSVYPNPLTENSNTLNIESVTAISEIEIYTIEGKLVSGKTTEIKDKKASLKVNSLFSGLYFVKVYHTDGTLSIVRFEKL